LVAGIGHVVIPVHDMESALGFYRDTLGFPVVGNVDPVWTVVDARGMELTLYLQPDAPRVALGKEGDDSPFYFHVTSFPKAASALEKGGFKVQRSDEHGGVVWDPSGNVLGLHDHRRKAR
jgi:catechol 2,3-dioxygenase-like lactoylglutathione lyase family enzyme